MNKFDFEFFVENLKFESHFVSIRDSTKFSGSVVLSLSVVTSSFLLPSKLLKLDGSLYSQQLAVVQSKPSIGVREIFLVVTF